MSTETACEATVPTAHGPAPAKLPQVLPRPLPPGAAWRRLHRAASAPYRRAGRFAWGFARGKLRFDPVFRAVLEQGLLPSGARVLDIGCGQGLVASLLSAVDALAPADGWPADWPPPPLHASYRGVDLMPRDVERARRALAALPRPVHIDCHDMCSAPLPPADVVLLLDVLHYVPPAAQDAVLRRVRSALAPGGRLLLRVGDQGQRQRFAISQLVDRCVTGVRGHRAAPTFGRSVPAWCALLRELGFAVRPQPMSRGTPFANVLLVADLPRTGEPR